ncbi:hypothetical protein HYFRA_00006018 [Hymenoscyphus fraxineus]|uniref:Beta-lactamase-related domain-containing protein n=1 Tax=Hymenoscyphus fraxineus TaxID=746836 RepID=A0A9N9KWJ3_9HELO|nr:hypothetical protein HYFRA_00006018 [Hymenoscyphus fraxineus]
MDQLEEIIRSATQAVDVPGVVLAASSATGGLYYEKAFGVRSLKEGQTPEPMTVNNVFYLASCTKVFTAVAIMQCVEQGLFTLDEDVTRLLPELEDIEILKGFDEGTGKPILVKATKTITLRHLLSHTSGFQYDHLNPDLIRWRKSRGEPAGLSIKSLHHRCLTPLVFEPGEKYLYSSEITKFVRCYLLIRNSSATSLNLEEYMKAFIWKPLGITSMTFHPEKHPEIMSSLADLSTRVGGKNKFGTVKDPFGQIIWKKHFWQSKDNDYSGGAGLFGRATDFIKLLHSITAGDGKVLRQDSIDELFRPQMSDSSRKHLQELTKMKGSNDMASISMPMGSQISFGLGGGMICLEDVGGLRVSRRAGTMFWKGVPNHYWWADRTSGLCGVYASSLVPTTDLVSIALNETFELAMYNRLSGESRVRL